MLYHNVKTKEWNISSSSQAATCQTTQFRSSMPSPSYNDKAMAMEMKSNTTL